MISHGLQLTVEWMQAILPAGWPGWILFVVIYAVACMAFVPGSILTLMAGLIHGFWLGILLVLLGNGTSALLSLLISRYWLRDRVTRYFAKNPKMQALKSALESEGWIIVCLVHLSPIMPFGLVNYAFGLTSISVTEFLLATELGSLPSATVYVYFGTLIDNFSKAGPELQHHRPLEWFLRGLGILATVAVTVYVSRIASRAMKKRLRPRES